MKLSLKAFRGATIPFELQISDSDNLTIIYGENGSGKTTISDAFDLLFKQTSGSLHEKSIDGKNKISSLVSNNANAGDLEVRWEEQGQEIKASIKGTKPIISGSTPSSLKTLRRVEVSRLVEDTPANRFKRIQDFVSLPSVENEEGRLSSFIKEQESLLQAQLQLAVKVEEDIASFYQTETEFLSPKLPQEKWIESVMNYEGAVIAAHSEKLSDLVDAIQPFDDEIEALENAMVVLDGKLELEKTAQNNLIAETQNSIEDYATAHAVLKQASTFFSSNSPTACPVCDNAIKPAEVAQKITNKLEQLQTLSVLADQVKKAKSEKQQAEFSLTKAKEVVITSIESVAQLYQQTIATGDIELSPLPEAFSEKGTPEQVDQQWIETCKNNTGHLNGIYNAAFKLYNNHIEKTGQKKDLQRLLGRRVEEQDEHTYLKQAILQSKLILKALQDSRVQYANQTLASISGDFAELYKAIHPNEDLENIRLYLNPDKKGSAVLDGKLLGKDDVSPVACLSESHLDTLGLCLFLSLEKMENSSNTILYLDDAIASVDEAHLERLYQLIVDQAVHFKHVILSAHYRPLRYKYKWGILNQGKVGFIELGKWNLNTGITFAKTPASETELLRNYLDEQIDPTTIASKSGIILEYLFDFLTGIYNSKLPRNPGAEQRWTLDNYKSGIAKLIKHLKVEHLNEEQEVINEIQLESLINDVFSLLQFRNCIGCHYKELTGYFDELSEALKLGNATIALVDALCDDQGRLPQHRNSGSYWADSRKNPTRRLHPLLPPS